MQRKKNDFLKVQISSIMGSALDYLSTIVLAETVQIWYLAANFTGNLLGGSLQFIMNREWVFKARKGSVKVQVIRFILVMGGNLLLSTAGVFILTSGYRVNYLLAKTIISVLLGLTYNYYLQKKFVFT